jgi:capsular exopolysaccharide synthesis family protein
LEISLRTPARRAVIVVMAVVLFTGIAAAAVALVPGHYKASAEVLLSPTRGANTTPLPTKLVRSLAAVADGATTDDAVAAVLGIDGDLGNRLSATAVGSTQVIRLTGIGETPDGAAAIAETGANQFISWLGGDGRAQGSLAAKTVPPEGETYPPRWTWLAAGGVVGLLAGLVLALRPRGEKRRISSISDLAAAADTSVLGVIGQNPDLEGSRSLLSLPTAHPVTEAMRIIRTNLKFLPGGDDIQLIVVTSPRPAEGKSTTSCSLAVSLAQTGASVVLLEGDLRRPQLAKYLGVSNEYGVTAVLVGQQRIDDALQPTQVVGLDVLTSGPTPPNPTEILQTTVMADLMLDLRDRYDFVIVDAPPVLPVADAPLLAALADGVVLVVRHDSTGVDQVQAALRRLHAVDAEVLGAVLTMSPRRTTQRYGYGYGYGESKVHKPKGKHIG